MSFETALRATEILMALAFLQQSAEHLVAARDEKMLFSARIVLCACLLAGVLTQWILPALLGVSLLILRRFDGPYNGGSDRMGLLVLCCTCLARLSGESTWGEAVLGYLALQTVLSYFISGQVKIANPEWRDGRALTDVFRFSAYPVSRELRLLAGRRRLLWGAGWAVMLFEVAFPMALLHPVLLVAALVIAALFHLANACLFGLNRFFWIWLAAYPSLIWFQARVFG